MEEFQNDPFPQDPYGTPSVDVPPYSADAASGEMPDAVPAPMLSADVPPSTPAPLDGATPPTSVPPDNATPSRPVPLDDAAASIPAPLDGATPSTSAPPRRRHTRRWLMGFLCGLSLALLLGVCGKLLELRRAVPHDSFLWDFSERDNETGTQSLEINIPAWPIGNGPVFTLSREHDGTQSAQEIYRNVNPSVVTVIVGLDDDTAAVGTGVIFSPDGYFVTNYHVIQGGVECRAMLDNGRSYSAFYVAGDEENDLAVLKMQSSSLLPAAQFGDSEALTVGDDVYAIGNPLGIEFRGTLTNGIVSAINRDVLVDGRTMTLIQTNAALNSGNSGGPLINQYGQVVGINVVKMSSRRSTVEGLGFSIPSASIERLVNDLLTYGESQPEPVIGISVDAFGTEVEPDVWGVGVIKVEPSSAAEKAGILVGDYILSADAEAVASSRDLLRVRRRYHIGDSMPLTLWRDGQRLDVTVVFTE